MIVIGVDPGLDTGICAIKDGIIEYACLTDPHNMSYHVDALVFIECPRIYPTGTPNPNDLITLAVMVGEYKEYFRSAASVTLVFPQNWKGQLPKAVTERRVRARFPDVDRWLVGVPEGKHHNVLDAVGIACYGYDKESRK